MSLRRRIERFRDTSLASRLTRWLFQIVYADGTARPSNEEIRQAAGELRAEGIVPYVVRWRERVGPGGTSAKQPA